MGQEFELNEELLQRYYDGELEEAEQRRVEKALEQDASAREFIEELAGVSRAMAELARECEPDEVSDRRAWEKIARRLHSGRRVRRAAWWGSAAAAAAVLAAIWLLPPAVTEARASNELDIESIDCTYAGFMILPPAEQDGHTIIWINDWINDSKDEDN